MVKMQKDVLKKNNNDEPEIYVYNIETAGQFKVEDIFSKSIEILMNRLLKVKDGIKNDNESKVNYPDTKLSMNAHDILFLDENDTIGNILQDIYDQKVHFVDIKYHIH